MNIRWKKCGDIVNISQKKCNILSFFIQKSATVV